MLHAVGIYAAHCAAAAGPSEWASVWSAVAVKCSVAMATDLRQPSPQNSITEVREYCTADVYHYSKVGR